MAPQPDHVLITNLVYRYAELVDSADFDGLGELFSDAVLHSGGEPLRGAAAIRQNFVDWVRVYPDNGTPHTRHITSNLIIEVAEPEDGGQAQTASARSYVTVLQYGPGNTLTPIFFVRYFDEFHRVDGDWRFASRRYVEPASGPADDHLLRTLDD